MHQLESQPKAVALFALLDELEALENSIDLAETEEERQEIELRIQSVMAATEHKADAYAGLIRREERYVSEGRQLRDAVNDRIAARENRIARIRQRAANLMRHFCKKKLEGLTAVVTLVPGQPVLDITGDVPAEFCTIIPPQLKPDRARIKAALKAGRQVTNASLKPGEPHIQIR